MKSTSRHLIIKLLKTKDKDSIVKVVRKKWQLTCQRKIIQMTDNNRFLTRNCGAHKEVVHVLGSERK